jgi:aminoglycoside phosphotransferase (APT) family kinase protein
MRAEVDVLRLIAARTEAPVPEVLAYDTTRRLIDNDFYLMTLVPGVALNKLRPHLPAGDQAAIDRRTGEYLRQVNAIAGPAFGYFARPELHFTTWREAFADMLDRVLQDGGVAAVELGVPYAVLATRMRRDYTWLDDVTQPALVHWDLWDGNIFVDPETRQITGMLDCERALWGDPLMEVNFGAFGLNPAFLEGYGVDLLSGAGAAIRRCLYNIYLWLIMIVESSYRQYETKDQESWARGKLAAELAALEGHAGERRT